MNYKSPLIVSLFFILSQIGFGQNKAASFAQNNDEFPVSINNVTILNSPALDFSPSYFKQGLVYCTARNNKGTRDKKINSTFFELYYADLDPNGSVLKPSPFSPEINSVLHEGPITFSDNGNQIFFTRNNSNKGVRKADKDGVTRLQIFSATKGNYDWENITALPWNADHYSCVHPTWDEQTQRLYFSSNMEDGQGGYDLYYVQYSAEGWAAPINLGAGINTAEDELFPFIHQSGYLFFASDGYKGYGGLDIYMSSLTGEDKRIINLGEPFNSELDDLGLILNANGKKGFFSSNRGRGIGQDDIYQFDAPNGIQGRTLPPEISQELVVLNSNTSTGISGAGIRIFEKKGDQYFHKNKSLFEAVLMPQENDSGQLIFKTLRKDLSNLGLPDANSDASGEAVLNLQGFKTYKLLVHAPGYETQEKTLVTTSSPSAQAIEIFLTPKNCLDIKGSVDSELTQGPVANAVIKIVSKKTGLEEILLSNAQGKFNSCLHYGDEYKITAYKERFKASSIDLRPDDFVEQRNKQVNFNLVPDPSAYGAGTVIVLENIYYDFDKYQIRAGAALELEELAQIMRIYPSMEIELVAHTDSRGAAGYNLKLSGKRAASAKRYLMNRGIAENRMKTRGFGEARPRNKCKDGIKCSELDHQYNRRTEVVITKMEEPIKVRYQKNAPEMVDPRGN